MRTRKLTRGKVTGIKFAISKENEGNDLKKVKAEKLKELKENEKNNKEWFDKELDKHLKKQ